jgi:hypothetical protein
VAYSSHLGASLQRSLRHRKRHSDNPHKITGRHCEFEVLFNPFYASIHRLSNRPHRSALRSSYGSSGSFGIHRAEWCGHPIRGPELRALRRLQRDYSTLPYVFSSERKAPLTSDAIHKILSRARKEAKLPFSVHQHMLRHACGYKLAQAGQDTRSIQHYLRHNNIKHIKHTVCYTHLSPDRFKDFWKGLMSHRCIPILNQ